MKTGKTFVGSLALVISLAATGCGATTMPAVGDHAGSVALWSMGPAAAPAPLAISPQPTPPDEHPTHFTNRVSRMLARATVTKTR